MIKISLCMIVKNEEDVLERCLKSIQSAVDEIIIVDTGSTDNTKAIAEKFTQKIYDFKWINDFSAARNYSFSLANMEYCMWFDADDVLLEKDLESLLELKKTLSPTIDVVMMKYNTSFDENGNPILSYYRERLIKNNQKYHWVGAVHEAIAYGSNYIYSDISVTHRKEKVNDPNRNINIFESMLARGEKFSAREEYYYARELYYHKRYTEAIIAFEQFLNEENAWVENKIEACQLLSICYKDTGDSEKSLMILFKSFIFDNPRAEICCEIGNQFFNTSSYLQAIFWYKQALNCPRNDTSGGFINLDCYDYVPYLQLCVCYYRLNQFSKSIEYNEKAGKIKPNSTAYLFNKNFFLDENLKS